MLFGLGKLLGRADPAQKPPAPEPQAGESAHSQSVAFMRRDAVFNRERRIIGHVYRLQHPADAPLTLTPQALDEALLAVLCEREAGWGSKLGFIPISSLSLDDPLLLKLPPEQTVLLLTLADESTQVEALLARVQVLRGRGIRIGVFRHPRHPAFAPLLAQADFGAIDVAQAQGNNVRDFSIALRSSMGLPHPVELLGMNIESTDDVLLCRRCHFKYFHGPFARPGESWNTSKSGNPHKMHLMHLLHLVQSDAENREIAMQVKQDPVLTFRILRYLNSPAIALVRTITSIDEALVLFGRQKLMRWLSVLLFSVKDPDYADWLLVESSLTRGRLMELLGAEGVVPGVENDHLFLTGIFSTLDRILHIPLPQAIDQLKLPPEIQAALLRNEGPYAPLLTVAEACESMDGERIAITAERCHLDPAQVNQALIAATGWASNVTSHWD